jgi:hypothetical protein
VPWENKVDHINLKSGGTSRAYVLARLDRDRPDLAQRVRNGELSARPASRKKLTPFEQARSMKPISSSIVGMHFALECGFFEEDSNERHHSEA